jgi:putative acetyltransferase
VAAKGDKVAKGWHAFCQGVNSEKSTWTMTIAEADPRSSEASILIGQFVEEVGQRYGTSPRTDGEALWPSCFDVEGRVLALAWLDGQPVGCGAILPVDPITTEFRRVYVMPDYRRQGIAAK